MSLEKAVEAFRYQWNEISLPLSSDALLGTDLVVWGWGTQLVALPHKPSLQRYGFSKSLAMALPKGWSKPWCGSGTHRQGDGLTSVFPCLCASGPLQQPQLFTVCCPVTCLDFDVSTVSIFLWPQGFSNILNTQMQDKAIELRSEATAVTRRSIYKSSFERPAIKSISCITDEKILAAYH